MDSNLGARQITERKSLGFAAGSDDGERNYKEIKADVMGEVKQAFRPEFLNRIDEIIVFHQLSHENIKEIAGKLLEQMKKRLLENKITAEITEDAIEKIAKEGFDPIYGARPLKRAIQSEIEDRIAEAMLSGDVKAEDTIVIAVEENQFVCNKKE